MSKKLHSHNQFHAAGHGTFFSGQILPGRDVSKAFVWVYDCGSKRSGRMPALVQDFEALSPKTIVDLLCISHFDSDHVNGLKSLLKTFTVDVLALPYLPLSRRLEVVSALDEDRDASGEAMLFCLDPAGYLATRGLGDRVERIVLVKGGERPASPAPDNPRPNNPVDDDGPIQMELSVRELGADENYSLGAFFPVKENSFPAMSQMPHHAPARLAKGLWEMVFFNKDLPDGIAPKSKDTLTKIQSDIRQILDMYEFDSDTSQTMEGWRKDLRKCYDRHFGTSSVQRNDISLCVLSRPTYSFKTEGCRLFPLHHSAIGCAHQVVPVSFAANCPGLLLTGDISLDPSTITQMQNHFGDPRWSDIHVMQVPHHGSINSWQPGIASSLSHEYSVFCVPDTDSHGQHPHPAVVADLSGHCPLFANYSSSAVYAFHVHI